MREFVYFPNQRKRLGLIETWYVIAKHMWASRELIFQLFRRDFIMQYRKSYLGWGWLILSPIIGIVSWALLNSTGVLQPGEVGIPYPAYALISSSIWGLYMALFSSASGTLSAGMGFINQIKFPHEALLVKQLLQGFAGFIVTFLVNLVVLLLFGVIPDWKIVLFPILILPMMFLAAGTGLMLSVISVVAIDLTNVVNTFMGLLFYVTPIIYSTEIKSNVLQIAISLNPLTYLVAGVRDIIIYGGLKEPWMFVGWSVFSFLFFLLALRFFYITEHKVIEKIM